MEYKFNQKCDSQAACDKKESDERIEHYGENQSDKINQIRQDILATRNNKLTKHRRAIEDIELAKSMGLEISEFIN